MVINNGFILQYFKSTEHDTTLYFPISFTTINYAMSGTFWMEGIGDNSPARQISSIYLGCEVRHCKSLGGMIFVGY